MKRRREDEEVVIVEEDRRRLRDGRIEVRGTWVARGPGQPHRRRAHTRKRSRIRP